MKEAASSRVVLVAVLLGIMVMSGCDEVFEVIWPRKTPEDIQRERMTGEASFDRTATKSVYYNEKGEYSHPCLPRVRHDSGRSAEQTEMLDQMMEAYHRDDMPGTIRLARRCLESAPEDLEALIYLIRASARKKTHASLLPEMEKKAEGNPQSAAHQAALGYLYIELGDPSKCLSHLERARELNPDLPKLHYLFGRYWSDWAPRLDMDKALREYHESAQRFDDPISLSNLGSLYLGKMSDPCSAADVLLRFAERYELTSCTCINLVRSLFRCGREELAMKYLDEARQMFADRPPEWHNLGVYLSKAHRFDLALQHFEQGLAKYGKTMNVGLGYRTYSSLGMAQERLGRYEEAIRSLDRSLSLHRTGFAHFRKALALLQLGRNNQARMSLEATIEADPSITYARYYLGLLDHEPNRRFTKQDVDQIQYDFRDRTPANRLAIASEGRSKYELWDQAEEKLRAAFELEPKNGRAWAARIALENRRKNLDRAVEYGKQAIAQGIAHPYILNNLGYTYELKGDRRSALDYYFEAEKLMPQDVTIQTNIALNLDALGREDEARKHWYYAGVDLTFNPLGPYKNHAYCAAGLLVLILIVMRIRASRKKRETS
ncbi:MAG: tetratricopeptide repeat protein [Deltaproteobacteria bacterium]|nr:tetratricopeptide repeat protein [Deltaproteobacteria bacterium]